jgi:hypothetical protein
MLGQTTSTILVSVALAAFSTVATAGLAPVDIFTGNVGLSIDGIGSNNTPVGNVQAQIPAGSTILRAYLYSAGTPFPFYASSPVTLGDYNGAGITLAGNAITNFSAIVGATSTRADIGRWFTGRADVTSLVQSLVTAGGPNFSWSVDEGRLNNFIDGEVLVIAYSNPALAAGSVAILDGGQNTSGESTTVNLGTPLGNPNAAGFVAQMSIADSFSCCGQQSTINVNGNLMTSFAGNFDDGLQCCDGALITVGGIGDTAQSAPSGYDTDHELYDLRPFLTQGATSFNIFTVNPTNDDNIFFMGLTLSGDIGGINATPEPTTLALLGIGLLGLRSTWRRRAA